MDRLSLRSVWIVLRREYAQRIFSRSFIGTTLFTPALFLAIISISVVVVPKMAIPTAPAGGQIQPEIAHGPVAVVGAATVSMLLFYTMILSVISWGAVLMRAVLEEKQSRVLEVLLGFASPEELMTGKILGIGALSSSQVFMWLVLGVALVVGSPIGRATAAMMHLGPSVLGYFLVFEALGYLLYSALFCALGAALNSAEEVQQWIIVLMLPLFGTMALIPTALTSPNSGLALLASIFPITAPTLMFALLIAGHPPAWQVVLSLGLLAASIWIAIWLSARIYRVGILMYGKRPTVREIARWMLYA